MSGLPAAVADWLYQVVQPIYEDPKRVFHDAAEVLDHYRHLRPRTRVFTSSDGQPELLLCVYGNIKVELMEVPVLVWVPRRYPREFPHIYIDLEALGSRQLKLSRHLDSNGRLYLGLAEQWDAYRGSLVQVVRHLAALFSRSPPILAPPVSPVNGAGVLAPSDPPEDPSCAPRAVAPPLPPKSHEPLAGVEQRLENVYISTPGPRDVSSYSSPHSTTVSLDRPPPPLPPQTAGPSSAGPSSAETGDSVQWSRPPGPPPPLSPAPTSTSTTEAPSLPSRPQKKEHPHVRINDEVTVYPAGDAVPKPTSMARPPVLPERPAAKQEPEVDLLDMGGPSQGDSDPHARAINELKKSMLEMLSYDQGYGRDQVQSRLPHIQVAVTQFDDMYTHETQRLAWLVQSIAASKETLWTQITNVDRETQAVNSFIEANGKDMDPEQVATAETRALNQLYELVAKDRAITDTIHALSRLLNCGALGFDQFVKKVRELARTQFTTRLHIRKIVSLLEN
ncbi:ubiquitin-binding ESCRT-I subunit protein STP22 RNJ42_01606 [Nakaseomyces bracarensis]|uniref:ubiquitin-binding ESCRT-I subunit protein STP22 n=1 Tax=Nakaseomyces bracarensis TaxID=273131 RepID=UPI0038714F59